MPTLWPAAALTPGMSMPGGTAKPVRRSRSRRPARGASTVRTSALIAAVDGLVDQRVGHAAVAQHVELKPARRRRARRRRPRAAVAVASVETHISVPAPAAARAIPGSPSGWAMRCRATGRDEHRHRDLGAQDGRRGRDVADVDQHARQQLAAGEGGLVVGQRALVAGAAGEVAERARVEALGDERLEVAQADRPAGAAGSALIAAAPGRSRSSSWPAARAARRGPARRRAAASSPRRSRSISSQCPCGAEAP